MTMADTIAVMNHGRIEQLGGPTELYERPRTAFVAGFLGVSNLLAGTVTTAGSVRVDGAGEVRINAALPPPGTRVQIGVRPEKLRLDGGGANSVAGTVKERAYIGVATQYVVETPAGNVTVFVQSSGTAVEGDAVTLSWDPESTFVVEEVT
jgi:spermidine/putrescine transport system ATP-binding protein